ncbi:MAG: hypothetical protein IJ660_01450 [Alphaproteobacteria bacterium]|nr:hypothetical protein [Alphaproteobacteria bacterium]
MISLQDQFYEWLLKEYPEDKKHLANSYMYEIEKILYETSSEDIKIIREFIECRNINKNEATAKYIFYKNVFNNMYHYHFYSHIGWEELAANLPLIILGYKGRKKTALQKYNEFLSNIDISQDILHKQNQNILRLIENKLPTDKKYLTSKEYANLSGHDERVIKRWRKERIKQNKIDQLTENPYGQGKIGPRFVMDGGRCRYYIDDLNAYYGRDIKYL